MSRRSRLVLPRERWGPFIEFTWLGVLWLAAVEFSVFLIALLVLKKVFP